MGTVEGARARRLVPVKLEGKEAGVGAGVGETAGTWTAGEEGGVELGVDGWPRRVRRKPMRTSEGEQAAQATTGEALEPAEARLELEGGGEDSKSARRSRTRSRVFFICATAIGFW